MSKFWKLMLSVLVLNQCLLAYEISEFRKTYIGRGVLSMPQRNHDGNYLAYHLCRINTKNGKILREDNFKKDDEAWTVCAIAQGWRNLKMKK